MTTVTTRAGKGSALTYAEMDANFTNLNNAKLESGTAGANIANTPAGNIVATNVQDAINELDQEKASLGVNSDITSMTGLTAPTASSNPIRAEDIQKQLVQAFTTGGTNTAYTLTPSPAISSNSVNLRFRIKFNTAAGNTPTLSVSSQPALSLKYIDSNGNKQSITATQVPLNWVSDVECDGTNWVVLQTVPQTVVYASSAENAAGSIENKAVDPLGIREAFNATGSAPVYACRAWVNFNGTGTVAIRASGNVSSITDNGTGDYTVNFTTAMPDANYAVNLGQSTNNSRITSIRATSSSDSTPVLMTTSAVRILHTDATTSFPGTPADVAVQTVSIFR